MQIRPTAFTIGLIIYSFIALFFVYTEFGIDSLFAYVAVLKKAAIYDYVHSSFLLMKCYTERAVDKHPKIW